jgi:hypothetical protein
LLNNGDDAVVGQSNVIVLSHRYWTRRFSADQRILGETLIVNGQPFTIVGVAPEGFDGTTVGSRPQFFVPISMTMCCSQDARSPTTARLLDLPVRATEARCQHRISAAAINRRITRSTRSRCSQGMSPANLERFKAKGIEVTPAPAVRARRRGRVRSARPPALGHIRCPAQRVREHRQPAARQGRGPRR